MIIGCWCVYFFKQKTAYEMRIRDWSSDVCSSDLAAPSIEGGAAFLVDQPGGWIGEARVGIAERLDPLGLEEERPAGAEAAQDVVRPRARADQLGLSGAPIGRASWRERVCQYV